jgi:hypothetical protein
VIARQREHAAFDQRFRICDGAIGLAGVVLHDQLDLATADTAGCVRLRDAQLQALFEFRAIGGENARQGRGHADHDLLRCDAGLGGARTGHGRHCNECRRDRRCEAHHTVALSASVSAASLRRARTAPASGASSTGFIDQNSFWPMRDCWASSMGLSSLRKTFSMIGRMNALASGEIAKFRVVQNQ